MGGIWYGGLRRQVVEPVEVGLLRGGIEAAN